MAIELRILTGTSVPIFRQIVDQVRLAAATGRVSPGESLPSVRALAERLLVNPNTIAKAYSQLAGEGVVETRQGKGVVIASPRNMYTAAERQRRLSPALDILVREALSLGFTCEQVQAMLQRQFQRLSEGGTDHE